MDIFEYLPDYQILICKPCQYAVSPSRFVGHVWSRHRNVAGFQSKKEIVAALAMAKRDYLWKNAGSESISVPPAKSRPFPLLPIHKGYRCLRCTHVCTSQKSISAHVNGEHADLRRSRGQHTLAQRQENQVHPRWEATFCQRFFVSGPQSSYFCISPPAPSESLPTSERFNPNSSLAAEDSIRAQIEDQLEQHIKETKEWHHTIPDTATAAEVSPWLEMTRWPKYLGGHDFAQLALLADRPDPIREPILQELTRSLGRVIEAGHRSIQEDKVNVFDQARINSFIQRRRASDRPLMIKLQKATWRQYTSVWQRLICFAYRTVLPESPVQLSHRMTHAQMGHLDQAIQCAEDLIGCQMRSSDDPDGNSALDFMRLRESRLDRAMLFFCISLLDHTLTGDLFESTIVGFLAVLGIDVKRKILQDACTYTPSLSGLIKIGQVLVIQRSVLAAEEGEVDRPADLLDEMRERFMIHGSRSPFNWALRLRAYGKKIRNSTTSLGYVYWSTDNEKLSYKTTELEMPRFQNFVRVQVNLIQAQLEDVLLLHPNECREHIVPTFVLRRLKDNPSEKARSWSFLDDHRNREELPNGARWLLNRVLANDWLRDEFIKVKSNGRFDWLSRSVDDYLARVDRLLERLLLLIHITSGQPARGTEIVSLRYHNTVHGHQRNIFLDEGMVSTVTSYHKGYSITGSTKIIHRYLPKEVGEVVVYYLWLIRPFTEKLQLLALGEKTSPSPYLWAKGKTCWDSSRLTNVLKEEAKRYLKTELSIGIYRHVAIAISKEKLAGGGFKRDYGLEENGADNQATHASWTAGTVYARGLEEAPGHVKARQAEYRAVSQEWHDFLGFPTYTSNRKRPLGEIENKSKSMSTNAFKKTKIKDSALDSLDNSWSM